MLDKKKSLELRMKSIMLMENESKLYLISNPIRSQRGIQVSRLIEK